MFDERRVPVATEGLPPVQTEYGRCIKTLNKVGIISLLPQSESLGVVGIDGKEYPIPSPDQVQGLFDRNKELVKEKRGQGFTKLQLTPLAIPIPILAARAKDAIQKHAKEGKIFQAKQNSTDPDIAASVNTDDPLYMWDEWLAEERSGNLIYFPASFNKDHHGLKKADVINANKLCATPGWSVGLVDPSDFLPKEGQGKVVRGRKQLENNHTPTDYLQTLQGSSYKGESGWTIEDFLTDFLTRLEETNQVSHDWDDNSAVWLTGNYSPNQGFLPVGLWSRGDRQLGVVRGAPGVQYPYWGVRSTVRLGT